MPRLSTFGDVVSGGINAFRTGQQDAARRAEAERQQQHRVALADVASRLQSGENVGDVAPQLLGAGDLQGFTRLSQLDNANRAHQFRQNQARADSEFRESQAAENTRRFGITSGQRQQQIDATRASARATSAATAEQRRVQNEFRQQEIDIKRHISSNKKSGLISKGDEKTDTEFAKRYVDWTAGGKSADFDKQLGQLEGAAKVLESGAGNISGPIVGNIPDFIGAGVNPQSIQVREAVEEVVQRNLRLILGAQFTQKEGDRLIARAFNPRLSETENAKRVRRLMRQMQSARVSMDDASQYFQQNGTLKGWQGRKPTLADFDPDRVTPSGGQATPPLGAAAQPQRLRIDLNGNEIQ